jgi:hypothetical protein
MAYKSIHDTFWTDPKVKKLKPETKLAYLYLITNHHSHYSGIYYLPVDMVSLETGISKKNVKDIFGSLKSDKFMKYDNDMAIVWVINMAKYQINGQKQVQGAANHLSTLHNCPLIKEFLEKYKDLNIPYQYPIEGVYGEYHKEEEEETEEEKEDFKKEVVVPSISVQDLMDGWNDIVATEEGFKSIAKLTEDRKKKMRLRLKAHPESDFWNKVLNKIPKVPFLSGKKKMIKRKVKV